MAFEGLSDKLGKIFKNLKGYGKLNEKTVNEAMREVKMALLEADVSYKVVKKFVADVSERAVGSQVMDSLTPAQQVIDIVHEELCKLMGGTNARIDFPSKPPCIIMMCGLQGSGKTTHSAKLAKYLKSQNRRPLLVACDIYRPAAIDQLKVVGEKAGARVFEMGQTNPVIIAKESIKFAKDNGFDVVILDTAGRLHIDEELMNELKEIKAETNPTEILLVVDSMTGQDAVNVAKSFNELLDITGVVLTKLDGDTRGGAALSVLAVTGKPIKFAGVGEKIDDLEQFHPDRMADRILGMGDMLSLIEKAKETYDEKEAEKLAKKLQTSKFDMNDLLAQFEQIEKMGSVSSLINMIPGLSGKVKEEDIDERRMPRTKAIILSMTKREREKPSIIDAKRKRRIAAGSGTKVEDVNNLLKQFDQMQKMMKQMTGKGGKRKMLGMMRNMGGMGNMGGFM
ncbi:MAG: signal recognition particle protein [Ruminiclostridium sp.]|nr:signal recognition particle protein [Ruminiclostridium sp.]